MGKIAPLISYTGSVEAILDADGGPVKCGEKLIQLPTQKEVCEAKILAEQELEYIEQNDINMHFYLDDDYPKRLKNCPDAPILLFGRGNYDLNPEKVISVVGTRNATDYGKFFCDELIHAIQAHDVLIVSGMAYGIDICAHIASVEHNLPTVGVLAHGVDRLYPEVHQKIANKMLQQNGGLVTEFPVNTNPDREKFPSRNRIVAGMADATIVLESGQKGGSLITADLAFHYNRDVMALPGDVKRDYSIGCNQLIRNQKASMLTCPEDLIRLMDWDIEKQGKKNIQRTMFVDLNEEQKKIFEIIQDNKAISIDELMISSEQPMSKLSPILLDLEMNGVITQMPGKRFQVIN